MFRPVDTPTAADFFCGGGGASEGVLGAGVELRFAANHDAVAIATHAHRHPHVDHYQVDLVDYDVAKMPRVQMAHFSPSCVHHSQANASKVYERPATLFDHIHGDGPDPEARTGLRILGAQPGDDVVRHPLRRRPPARPDDRRERRRGRQVGPGPQR